MRAFALLGLSLCVACGGTSDIEILSNAPTGGEGRDDAAQPLPLVDSGIAQRDSGEMRSEDAGTLPPKDASVTPGLSAGNVTASYAAGKDQKVWKLEGATFTEFASVGCPRGEETAVMTDGRIFVTSERGDSLFAVAAAGCVRIGPPRKQGYYPYALGIAPKGTFSNVQDTLVGYDGAAYVSIDVITGNVTVVNANALGDQLPGGDVTAINTDGYVAIAAGTGKGAMKCRPTGDCIQKVDLVTGTPIGMPIVVVGAQIVGLAHDRGTLLLFRLNQVSSFDLGTGALSSVANYPGGLSFSGAGSAPWQ
jgi:hypothetical protein